ncbi:MAG: hypothetical protein KH243_13465 [Lachnospiraceae bacterium]|nr:hypothetical protein [Lachnospiraceae bacterium]
MNKKEIIDELHKMGYEVKEETLVKNGVNVLGVSIIDSDRFMIPVFHIDDIIKKAESIKAKQSTTSIGTTAPHGRG